MFLFSSFAFLERFDVKTEDVGKQRTLTAGGRITVQLVSSSTRLDLTDKENKFFVCSEPGDRLYSDPSPSTVSVL